MLRVVLEQAIVEDLLRYRIEPEIGLIEKSEGARATFGRKS
jgi:hypothetical protein